MTVSKGPYARSSAWFINLQDIKFEVNRQGDYIVKLGISNETTKINRKKDSKFINFVYFFESKEDINKATSSTEEVVSLIKQNSKSAIPLSVSHRELKTKATTQNSQAISSYFYEKSYTLKSSKNLYVLLCSYIQINNNIIIGNITKETILEDNLTPIKSFVYVLDETVPGYGEKGTIWPGSIHQHKGKLMAGAVHIKEAHPTVSTVEVPSLKIKDMRVIDLANRIDYSFETLSKSYFSPLTTSRNRVGHINGTFTFNLYNFAKNNTRLGGLIENNSTLRRGIKIKDIIIYQKITGRDTRANTLTPAPGALDGLSKESVFKRVASLGNNCLIVDNLTGSEFLIQVCFKDDTVLNVSSGQAEYKAEIIFEDMTANIVRATIKSLRSSSSSLDARLKSVSLPVQVKDRSSKGELIEVSDAPPNNAFIQKNDEFYNKIINEYLNSIKIIFGDMYFTRYTENFWRNNLQALVNSLNPSLDVDRIIFAKIIQTYVFNISKTLQPPAGKTDAFDVKSRIRNASNKSDLRAIKEFNDFYVFTGTKSYGLNVIDDTLENSEAVVPSISFANYSTRVGAELQKFGISSIEASPTNGLNPVGFLTAQQVSITPNPFVFNARTLDIPLESALPVIQSRNNNNRAMNLNKSLSDTSQRRNILASLGIAVNRNKTPIRQIINNKNRQFREIIDSQEYLSSTSNFVYENPANATNPTPPSNVAVTLASVDVTNNAISTSLVEQSVFSFNNNGSKPTITNQEQLRGSAALMSMQQNADTLMTTSTVSDAVNYNSVQQVQYLDSYDISEGIAKQNWKLLTQNKFNNSVRDNASLLCRLVKVGVALGTEDILNLDSMAGTFVLGQAETKAKDAIPQQDIEPNPQPMNTQVTTENIFYSKNIPVADAIVIDDSDDSSVTGNVSTTVIRSPLAQGIGY
jgi:hypothetical protein